MKHYFHLSYRDRLRRTIIGTPFLLIVLLLPWNYDKEFASSPLFFGMACFALFNGAYNLGVNAILWYSNRSVPDYQGGSAAIIVEHTVLPVCAGALCFVLSGQHAAFAALGMGLCVGAGQYLSLVYHGWVGRRGNKGQET